jgi:N-carbamoylputrescine amidase
VTHPRPGGPSPLSSSPHARRPYQIAAVQMSMSETDLDGNVAKAVAFVEKAASDGAKVICLPELFKGPYFCQREDMTLFGLAEPIPGPTTEAIAAAAKRLQVTILCSVFERRAPGVYHNTLVVLGPDGGTLGVYRKMHIPDDPLFYEKYYFAPGDLGFKAVETPVGPIGTLVCWDQWYPEAARLTALQGAEVLFYPTAIGWHPAEKAEWGIRQHDAWRTVQRGHAVANGIYVCSVNRTGHEGPADGGLEFWGQSFIADPLGTILAEAPADKEVILHAEVNPTFLEETRRYWPFLRDRRIDAFGGLLERFGK